jgi:hypothetical protein
MKLFCKVRLGEGILETPVDYKNTIKPMWSSQLDFARRDENKLRVELYHKNRFSKPKLLGETFMPLDPLTFIAELYGRCVLKNGTNVIGHLDIQIKWEPEYGEHPSQISMVSFVNDSNRPGSPGYPNNALSNIVANDFFMTLQQNIPANDGRQIAPSQLNLPRNIFLPHFSQASDLQTILENFTKSIKNRIKELEFIKEPEEGNIPDGQECVVCCIRRRAGVFYKCGHKCCCVSCGAGFIGKKCPICRELVFDFVKIYEP